MSKVHRSSWRYIIHSIFNFSYVSAGGIDLNFMNNHWKLPSPLLGWIFCFVPLHHDWQNIHFRTEDFLRRFCQIPSGFHFVGLFRNIYIYIFCTEPCSQIHVQPPTWRIRWLYFGLSVTAWPSYPSRHQLPFYFVFCDFQGYGRARLNTLHKRGLFHFPIQK
jgi:hypothetical protein